MSTKQLILVRHSTVAIDTAVSSHNWSLSADGRSRAAAFATRLRPHAPTRIITSREPKAIETGQVIATALGLPPATAVPGLQEHDRQGTPFTDPATFRANIARLLIQPDKLVFGNETGHAARIRLETAVSHLTTTTDPNDTLLLVTHGTILTLFLCHHNPHLDPVAFWLALTQPAAAVISLPDYQLTQIITSHNDTENNAF